MTQVFVSSTYTDLVEYRKAVCDRIRQIGAIDVAMEHLGARDERPKDECLQLVRTGCDIFIGIYAHRYGSIPKGEERSITELEYRAATDAGIKRLIYMIDDNTPWVRRLVDQGTASALLESFKEHLKTNHVIRYFTNKDDLAASVAADLGRELAFSLYKKVNVKASPTKNPKTAAEWNAQRIRDL